MEIVVAFTDGNESSDEVVLGLLKQGRKDGQLVSGGGELV